MVDWSVFWPNLLITIISSIITLLIGWLIAWRLIHRYQRRNIKMQNRNMLIEEISAFETSLKETTESWFQCQREREDLDLVHLARNKLMDLTNNRKILFAKMLNQYPEFIDQVFEYKDDENKSKQFTLNDISSIFNKYVSGFTENFENGKFSEDSGKVLLDKWGEISFYLTEVLVEIISESIEKVLKKRKKKQ